jgi:hypothetical protein
LKILFSGGIKDRFKVRGLINRRYFNMDNWTFGITMIIVGMGGTLLTLWILSLIMSFMKKIFPYTKEEN